jgi:hypothetical protein
MCPSMHRESSAGAIPTNWGSARSSASTTVGLTGRASWTCLRRGFGHGGSICSMSPRRPSRRSGRSSPSLAPRPTRSPRATEHATPPIPLPNRPRRSTSPRRSQYPTAPRSPRHRADEPAPRAARPRHVPEPQTRRSERRGAARDPRRDRRARRGKRVTAAAPSLRRVSAQEPQTVTGIFPSTFPKLELVARSARVQVVAPEAGAVTSTRPVSRIRLSGEPLV